MLVLCWCLGKHSQTETGFKRNFLPIKEGRRGGGGGGTFVNSYTLYPSANQRKHNGQAGKYQSSVGVLVNTAKLKLVLKQSSFRLREKTYVTSFTPYPSANQRKHDGHTGQCQSSKCIGSHFHGRRQQM